MFEISRSNSLVSARVTKIFKDRVNLERKSKREIELDSFIEMPGEFNTALIETEAQSLLFNLPNFYRVNAFVAIWWADLCVMFSWAEIPRISILPSMPMFSKIAPRIAELLQGKFVLLDEVNKIGRDTIKDWTIDMASFTGKISKTTWPDVISPSMPWP